MKKFIALFLLSPIVFANENNEIPLEVYIANLDLSKTEISDKAIMAILVELRRNVEEHTEWGEIWYGENGYFYHWTERMGGVDDFNEFVKAITARNSKKITSELILLKNCFEEYFKMLKKENIEDYVEEPIQAWIDAFGQ